MFLLNIITKIFLRPELSRKDAIIIQHIVLIATLELKDALKMSQEEIWTKEKVTVMKSDCILLIWLFNLEDAAGHK
jgi:hypothetical protein